MVRKQHILLFDEYKKYRSQVRALVAIGTIFLIKSRKSAVLVDRAREFDSALIDAELEHLKYEGALLSVMKSLASNEAVPTIAEAPSEDDPKEPVGPYERLRRAAEDVRSTMPHVHETVKMALDARSIEGQYANNNPPDEDDLERY